ncbi:MAG: Lrp/AsnC family transcriptional regulator, partial [Chloroflexi bacterium]|nr:Lrp/AsnC family transcriptional regulator [Chloroflexota bacterium]
MASGKRIDNELDETDRRILNLLQSDFPLTGRPFAELGTRLGISETEAVERTKRLKESGIIRQISAIFDSRALGYESTLAAMQVPADRLDEVAAMVSEEAGVSHNYARNHPYNLWFTLTVPPGVDPQQALSAVAARVGVDKCLHLPALRVFKIGVRLDMEGDRGQGTGDRVRRAGDRPLATSHQPPT